MISARHLLEGKWAEKHSCQYNLSIHRTEAWFEYTAGLISLHSSVIELLITVSIVDLPHWRVTTAVTNNVRSQLWATVAVRERLHETWNR